ncbi:MAG: signal recognition particle protein, partial [Nitrosomonas sp. PRO5]|nr:signal recognition particle protein [Nitrosomonas sp. PRO5]
HEELVAIMGGDKAELNLNVAPPAVILMAGLQGAGKTTSSGKLAKWLMDQKKKVLLVSCDVYRPAAIDQLALLAEQTGADFFPVQTGRQPAEICTAALDFARKHHHDVIIVDTAGRLGIDEAMMREISQLEQLLKPAETLFVVDAMQGQDAVNTAKAFAEVLPLTGVILTKLDGDARGGAALSVRHITGKPIKFAGVAEKLNGLEPFYPDRMASRILGMGDVLGLIEEAQRTSDQKEAERLMKKMKSGKSFDLNDFQQQFQQMKKMGGMSAMLEKLPHQLSQAAQNMNVDEKIINRTEGIINSMTPQERIKPEIIKASRKRRIAAGSGVSVQEVNRLLSQFEQARKMMKMMNKGGMAKMMRAVKGMLPHMR